MQVFSFKLNLLIYFFFKLTIKNSYLIYSQFLDVTF